MTTLTIPKNLIKNEDLVVLSRSTYENIMLYFPGNFKEISLNANQKQKMKKARQNLSKGKFLTIHELRNKLEA